MSETLLSLTSARAIREEIAIHGQCQVRIPGWIRPGPEAYYKLGQRLKWLVERSCDLPAGHTRRHMHNNCRCPEWNFAIDKCLCDDCKCGCW